MEHDIIQLYADLLFDAERDRDPIGPLTKKNKNLTIDNAYQIQLDNVSRVLNMGHKIAGKKIGLTSPGIQKQLGVNEPDYGHLFESMNCKNGEIKTKRLIQPKIEGELAFVLKEDLTGGKVTVADVKKATDYVVAAFEIVDSRVADWDIQLVDTVADNASSGRYVLGKTKLTLEEFDPAKVTMKLYKNGEQVEEGTGDAVLGDPCIAVAWLANRLFDYGVTLKKGEVILSGAFSAAPLAKQGDEFIADFSEFGKVKAKFV